MIPRDVEILHENKQAWPGNTRKLATDSLVQYNAPLRQTRARKHEGDDG